MPPRCQEKTRCTPKKKLKNIDNGIHQLQGSGENDRLSSLPDNLLISILSLMPISSAVVTSVLSHRWRHLWTHITHISFSSWSSVDSFRKFKKCITIINHVISKLASPKIHTFHLQLELEKLNETDCTLLIPIVYEICLRNPEVITILFLNKHDYLCQLPTSLFNTQSLVELRLDSIFEFNCAADAKIAISLPNLKILDMSLSDSHHSFMHTLFKSFPLLECLCCLKMENGDHYVDIIAPNLKFLTVECHHKNYLLLIDAPMLVNLKTCGDGLVSYHFIKNLRFLQEANISIPKYHVGDGNAYVSRILALFQGISCARSLTFDRCFHDHLLDVTLPSFLNLVDLSFDGIDLGPHSWMPSCLLRYVKNLKFFHMKPNDYGIRFLKDILSNATVLELLQVSLYKYNDGDRLLGTRLWKEYEFAMKLFKLPRSSSSFQIELCGDIITASCDDYRHGQLACKLQDLTA